MCSCLVSQSKMCSCLQSIGVPVPAHSRAGAPWRHAFGTLHHLPPLPRPAPPRARLLPVALGVGWLCTQGHPAGGTVFQRLPDFLWEGSKVESSFVGRRVATYRIYHKDIATKTHHLHRGPITKMTNVIPSVKLRNSAISGEIGYCYINIGGGFCNCCFTCHTRASDLTRH